SPNDWSRNHHRPASATSGVSDRLGHSLSARRRSASAATGDSADRGADASPGTKASQSDTGRDHPRAHRLGSGAAVVDPDVAQQEGRPMISPAPAPSKRSETMIALRARREALKIARDIAYPQSPERPSFSGTKMQRLVAIPVYECATRFFRI